LKKLTRRQIIKRSLIGGAAILGLGGLAALYKATEKNETVVVTPQPIRTAQPTQKALAGNVHKSFISMVTNFPRANVGVGLTDSHNIIGDVDKLNCGWFYDWACTVAYLPDPRYVPMSYSGRLLTTLPVGYSGYVLMHNEPDTTGQDNYHSPSEAAAQVLAMHTRYPNARLIVGGTTQFGYDWLVSFKALLGTYQPEGYHIHAYVFPGSPGDPDATIDYLKEGWFPQVLSVCTGQIWITEFADTIHLTNELLSYIQSLPWVTRYAWFANRMYGTESWYPDWPINPALIDEGGNLTPFGEMYTPSGI